MDRTGTYDINIYIWCKPPPNNHWEMIYDANHQITWPVGDPVFDLDFAINGNQLELE